VASARVRFSPSPTEVDNSSLAKLQSFIVRFVKTILAMSRDLE